MKTTPRRILAIIFPIAERKLNFAGGWVGRGLTGNHKRAKQHCLLLLALAAAVTVAVEPARGNIVTIITADFDQTIAGAGGVNSYGYAAGFYGGDSVPPMGTLAARMNIGDWSSIGPYKEWYCYVYADLPYKITYKDGRPIPGNDPINLNVTYTNWGQGGASINGLAAPGPSGTLTITEYLTEQYNIRIGMGMTLFATPTTSNVESQMIVDPVISFIPGSWAEQNLQVLIPQNGKNGTEGWVLQDETKRNQEFQRLTDWAKGDRTYADWQKLIHSDLATSVPDSPTCLAFFGALAILGLLGWRYRR